MNLDFRFRFLRFFQNKMEEVGHMKSFKITKCAKICVHMCYFHILSNFAENCYVESPSDKTLRCALFYQTKFEIWADLGRLGRLK